MVVLMVMVTQTGADVRLQAFVAVTHIVPPAVSLLTVTDDVPCPDVIVQPEGTVQV